MTRPPGMRWLLGVFEMGLFPGVSYYLSWCVATIALSSSSPPPPLHSWYKRSEFCIRVALFFSAASISGALGGLLTVCGIRNFSGISTDLVFRKVAISNIDGDDGKPGWAWIFILEGLATVVAGFLLFWIVQDFPNNTKFLSEAERIVVIRRLQSDDQYSAAGEKLKMKCIRQSLTDRKTYLTSKKILSLQSL